MCNYDHQALYSRGEKNGRLKNQMTASGDVMTMRIPTSAWHRKCSLRQRIERPSRAAGVIHWRLLRVTNK